MNIFPNYQSTAIEPLDSLFTSPIIIPWVPKLILRSNSNIREYSIVQIVSRFYFDADYKSHFILLAVEQITNLYFDTNYRLSLEVFTFINKTLNKNNNITQDIFKTI